MKLGNLLAATARRHRDKTALVCDGARMTFGELDSQSNRVAQALRARGLAIGDRVAVYMPNGNELVVAVCGALKAGGVVVPISTRLAAGEIATILEDSAPATIVFPAEYRATLHKAAAGLPACVPIVHGEAAPGELSLREIMTAGDPTSLPPLPPEPDDALIAYTSGTTGKPKGGISTHANLTLGQGLMTAREWGLTGDDVIMVTTPMAHRIGIARISNAICLGATLVIVTKFDPAEAVGIIEETGVSVLGLVPTIARMMLPEIAKRPEACRSLRVIVATGEAFPDDVQHGLTALLPDLRIFGFYSQTEAGFVASMMPEDKASHPGSCGRIVPGVDVRIVDEKMQDVELGQPGEILVRCGRPGQYSVMRAYFNRPEATAEVFVEGWLRTGDVGRMDADGFLYFVDRAKDMIVSGGYNIYSREVELALLKHPAVGDVAVIGVPDQQFGESVMAYVQLAPGRVATASELIEHCREHIAGYKKPKHVHFVDTLPRNPTGKVLKVQLRQQAAGILAVAT